METAFLLIRPKGECFSETKFAPGNPRYFANLEAIKTGLTKTIVEELDLLITDNDLDATLRHPVGRTEMNERPSSQSAL